MAFDFLRACGISAHCQTQSQVFNKILTQKAFENKIEKIENTG